MTKQIKQVQGDPQPPPAKRLLKPQKQMKLKYRNTEYEGGGSNTHLWHVCEELKEIKFITRVWL